MSHSWDLGPTGSDPGLTHSPQSHSAFTKTRNGRPRDQKNNKLNGLSMGVTQISTTGIDHWPSFIEIGEIACSTAA